MTLDSTQDNLDLDYGESRFAAAGIEMEIFANREMLLTAEFFIDNGPWIMAWQLDFMWKIQDNRFYVVRVDDVRNDSVWDDADYHISPFRIYDDNLIIYNGGVVTDGDWLGEELIFTKLS